MERTGWAPSNFADLLPAPGSELAQQAAKDQYNFEFLGRSGEVPERDLEQRLTTGSWRSCVSWARASPLWDGRCTWRSGEMTSRLTCSSSTSSSCATKSSNSKPVGSKHEYAGKLNFYLAVVDDLLKREFHNDTDTVGILICGSKNDHTDRYALGRTTSPMAVSAYTYEQLPAEDKALVPGEDNLAAALDRLTDK